MQDYCYKFVVFQAKHRSFKSLSREDIIRLFSQSEQHFAGWLKLNFISKTCVPLKNLYHSLLGAVIWWHWTSLYQAPPIYTWTSTCPVCYSNKQWRVVTSQAGKDFVNTQWTSAQWITGCWMPSKFRLKKTRRFKGCSSSLWSYIGLFRPLWPIQPKIADFVGSNPKWIALQQRTPTVCAPQTVL